jgi:glutamate synthase domain-containing protein 2
VGFKLAIGRPSEFFSICKAMVKAGIAPDFITVDGGEGGTGAAPLEFSNSIGMPGREAWGFANAALIGVGLRDRVKILASGKVLTGFDMIRAMALGADACSSARGMMLALGCIQALRCNTAHCPTGVATQNRALYKGLVVTDKGERVHRYHQGTVRAFLELLSAMGLESPGEIRPEMLYRRIENSDIQSYAQITPTLEPGQLLDGEVPEAYRADWEAASADRF